MKINGRTELDPVYIVLYAIEHPEFRNNKKFREWLVVDNHKVLFEEVCRKYADGLDHLNKEEIDQEWIKCREKIRKGRLRQIKLWSSISTVAAVLIGVLFGLNMKPILQPTVLVPEYTAVSGLKEVTVQLDQQHPMTIVTQEKKTERSIPIVNLGHLQEASEILQMKAIKQETAHEMIITVPRGKSCHFVLEDGSEVWLNADSRLKYKTPFAHDERVVELEGEGFFKVTKNKEQPFYVHTKYFTTQVLGTEFNIRSYHQKDAGVTLIKGSVRVKDKEHETLIHPGEQALLGENGFKVETVNIHLYKAWIEGYFYFDESTLGDIMKELGRWYNVNIKFADPETATYKFNYWAYKNEKIEDAIAILNRLGKVSITMEGNNAVIRKQ